MEFADRNARVREYITRVVSLGRKDADATYGQAAPRSAKFCEPSSAPVSPTPVCLDALRPFSFLLADAPSRERSVHPNIVAVLASSKDEVWFARLDRPTPSIGKKEKVAVTWFQRNAGDAASYTLAKHPNGDAWKGSVQGDQVLCYLTAPVHVDTIVLEKQVVEALLAKAFRS
jgi:hypothetical protein